MASCYKRHTQPRESFALQGRVTDCRTGAPLAGVVIYVAADNGTRGGLFSGSSSRGAGDTRTDADGYFSIAPLAFENTEAFELSFQYPDYNSTSRATERDEIAKSGSIFTYDVICLSR